MMKILEENGGNAEARMHGLPNCKRCNEPSEQTLMREHLARYTGEMSTLMTCALGCSAAA